MADVVINRALGKIHQYAENVDSNSPASSVLRMFALVVTGGVGAEDNAIRDLSTMTMTGLFALTNVAEATNAGYANQAMSDADVTITIDDANNRVDIVGGDQTFTSVVAGDVWTDLVIAYDDAGTDSDAATIPLSKHDFAVTPNGGDITADEPVAGFARCAG